ncbi:hypothetical protein HYV31_03145 [candidate division WWE3 bacterium]|nr:hypothetical protein [candidate division WWE3 bacterium]
MTNYSYSDEYGNQCGEESAVRRSFDYMGHTCEDIRTSPKADWIFWNKISQSETLHAEVRLHWARYQGPEGDMYRQIANRTTSSNKVKELDKIWFPVSDASGNSNISQEFYHRLLPIIARKEMDKILAEARNASEQFRKLIDPEIYRPFYLDGKKYMFLKYGQSDFGWGLVPVNTPEEKYAIPTRRPGKEFEISHIKVIEVMAYHSDGFWYREGFLIEGVFYHKYR